MKSDNDVATEVPRDEVVNQRLGATSFVGFPPMHPQIHGRAGQAAHDITDQARNVNMRFERRSPVKVSVASLLAV